MSVLTNPAGLVEAKSEVKKAKNIFLMGSPAFDESKFSPLPGTLTEVNGIASVAGKNKIRTTKFQERLQIKNNPELCRHVLLFLGPLNAPGKYDE